MIRIDESPYFSELLENELVALDPPLAVPDFEQIRRSSREHERRSLRNGGVELLTACGERGGIRPRSQREIPAAVPAHTECPRRLHVPNRGAGCNLADTNPCDIGRHPPHQV